jgi:hypothetical protein
MAETCGMNLNVNLNFIDQAGKNVLIISSTEKIETFRINLKIFLPNT